ncbi:hypothetical protein PL78_17315 [Yersinia entomophaga]|uniref:Uncharacterized protein n=1 Tax=Yersinia entomophaga TaxID=935293 RepID=A0ABN4PX15_YERET|nr:hypothetical protein PL78_17315 [Yersinia entomophaga]OWF86233.1 hypothetical protein B4914_15440 [Yersinia entomophaga]
MNVFGVGIYLSLIIMLDFKLEGIYKLIDNEYYYSAIVMRLNFPVGFRVNVNKPHKKILT